MSVIAAEQVARVYHREAGTGNAVVCLHASASSSAQWRPLMDRLAGRFRTLAADLYGSGRSPAWPGERPLWLADEVALLEPVFEAAGPRFHLVGHSYGGAVALRAALADPGRVESLVLFEPVLFSLLTAEDPKHAAALEIAAVRDDTIAAVRAGDLGASGARFVDYWMGPGAWARMHQARRETIADQMRQVTAEWHAAYMDRQHVTRPAPQGRLVTPTADAPPSSRESRSRCLPAGGRGDRSGDAPSRAAPRAGGAASRRAGRGSPRRHALDRAPHATSRRALDALATR
jgi:pimeloyl-ACP methyl ester carboxylesterase